MIIMRKALSRRTCLRGAGVSLALPLLDAMVPALTAASQTAAKPAMRLGFFYVPNGVTLPDWYSSGDERSVELSAILKPLEPYRNQVTVIKGLANVQADSMGLASGPHTRGHVTWLSGVRPKHTEGADIQAGKTIDQFAADRLGEETPLTSLELALDPNYIAGNCDNGYSCVYQNTFSWRTPTTPLSMETNPRVAFERLFGDGGDPSLRRAEMRKNRSILDWVSQDMARLQRQLGLGDQRSLTGYIEAVRDVERRIQKAEQRGVDSLPVVEKPLGIPASDDEHAALMFDLQFLAYQADITRVVSFQIGREQSARTYPHIGVPNAHHEVSHHQGNVQRMALNTKINTFHVSQLTRLLEKMRATADGDGSLLDHAILLYGGGLGDGDFHNPHDLPVVLVGGGCGTLKGNRLLKAAVDTPMMNLGLSLLDKVGVELSSLGDSTGRLAGL